LCFVHFSFFCAQAPQSKERKTEPKRKKIFGLDLMLVFYTTLFKTKPHLNTSEFAKLILITVAINHNLLLFANSSSIGV